MKKDVEPHVPVLLDRVIDVLDPRPGQVIVDCTVGLGGHSAAILGRIGPGGRLIGMDLDDDNLERARQQLEADALLRAVAEGTTDAVYVKDREGRYLMINTAGARLLGRDVAEVIGRDDRAFFPLEEAEAIRDADRALMDSGVSDVYLMPGSEPANVLSLGVFSDYQRAQRRAEEIRILGLEPRIDDRKRAGSVYWVDVDLPDPGQAIDTSIFQTVACCACLETNRHHRLILF